MDLSKKTFHVGQRVIINDSADKRSYSGSVVEIDYRLNMLGFESQFCTVEFRRDETGADERREIVADALYATFRSPNGYSTGRVGNGKLTHIITHGSPICSAGRCTTGTKRNLSTATNCKEVDCTKCQKELAARPDLAAEIRDYLYYTNLRYFWATLAFYLKEKQRAGE